MSNLLLGLGKKMGIDDLNRLGDSTGVLDAI